MTTVDFITELFCQVDDQIGHLPKHSQARLYPSEVVTLALLALCPDRQRQSGLLALADQGLCALVSHSALSYPAVSPL